MKRNLLNRKDAIADRIWQGRAHSLCCFVFVAILVLCGCSGFTTDPPVASTPSESNLQERFAAARLYMSGSFDVTASSEGSLSGSLSISFDVTSGCVKQGESYQWKDDLGMSVNFGGGAFNYSFALDTLFLTLVGGEENGAVIAFVGGTPGELRGIWQRLGNSAYVEYWNFGERTLEIRVAEKENFNYMQSEFIYGFYWGLEDLSMNIWPDAIYYGAAVNASDYGVQILKQTNTSETFVYGGSTYEITIDSVHVFDDYLMMTVSSGNAQCRLEHFSTYNVTPEMCNDENADYLRFPDAHPNVAGRYICYNADEFWTCMKQMLVENSTSQDASSPFEKEFAAAHDRIIFPIHVQSQTIIREGAVVDDGGTDGGCFKTDDGIQWIDSRDTSYLDTMQFSFRGDSLLISYGNDVAILLGGKSGKLEGVWKVLDVGYDDGVRKTLHLGYVSYVKIESEKMTYAFDMNPDFNYMNSEFVENLHNYLLGESSEKSLYFYDVFFESKNMPGGVAVISQTNTDEIVMVNGKIYEVSLDYAYMIWNDVSITVKSDGKTCSGRTVQLELLTPELCKAENADYLKDYEKTLFYVVDEQDSFRECLSQMK